jgi:hypothetical protein
MKIYEVTDTNEYTYIFSENNRKEIKQRQGSAYIEYWNGREFKRMYFDKNKKAIRENYLLCKDIQIINDYFGVGYDLVIYILKDSNKLYCESSRWQGDNPFNKLLLYMENKELIMKLDKEFGGK